MQARYLFENEPQRDHFRLLQEASRHQLLALKQIDPLLIRYVTILADNCPECQKLNKKKYAIDQALKSMPIPVKQCSYDLADEDKGKRSGWCCCEYLPSRT